MICFVKIYAAYLGLYTWLLKIKLIVSNKIFYKRKPVHYT